VTEWEYRKIALNQLSPKTADVDVLNDAGDKGWELVAILPNNIAYLKRQVGESVPEATARGAASSPKDTNTNGNGPTAGSGYRAKVKYRDPATNETWSGRGLMASWLKRKQDAGEDIDDYLV
jgi:H-NS histone C-terminal domain